jgi:hypothetical protein
MVPRSMVLRRPQAAANLERKVRKGIPMRIVTLALAAAVGMAAVPVPAQTADPPSIASPALHEVVPAPAQQVPPQPAQPLQTQAPPASQTQQAQEQAPSASGPEARTAPPPRRYSFNRVNDGFVRFDNATGQVAYCSPHTVGWACQAVSEDRAALDQEIARLKDEVAALKEEITKLKVAAPPPPPSPAPVPPPAAAPPPDQGDEIRLKLPTHEDLARAQAYLADTWHRLVEMIDRFQRNLRDVGRDAAEDTSSI